MVNDTEALAKQNPAVGRRVVRRIPKASVKPAKLLVEEAVEIVGREAVVRSRLTRHTSHACATKSIPHAGVPVSVTPAPPPVYGLSFEGTVARLVSRCFIWRGGASDASLSL
jgi:hypothetical protein